MALTLVQSGLNRDLESDTDSRVLLTTRAGANVEASSGWSSAVVVDPVAYEGEKVVFDQSLMEPGVPYPFVFMGHRWYVIKNAAGEKLDFYYFEGASIP